MGYALLNRKVHSNPQTTYEEGQGWIETWMIGYGIYVLKASVLLLECYTELSLQWDNM